MLVIIIAAIAVLLILAFFALGSAYYARVFSEAHFREFHRALSQAIRAAASSPDQPEPDSLNDMAFITEGGVKAAVTFAPQNDGRYALHISLSQAERATTHAFANRFAFFVVAMLQGNRAELTPYFTRSGVRHLVFQVTSPTIAIQDFDTAYAGYRDGYKPIPFEYRDLET